MLMKDATAEAHFAACASKWAQQLELPKGNLWEPAITRVMTREWIRLGANKLALAAVVGIYSARLGVKKP